MILCFTYPSSLLAASLRMNAFLGEVKEDLLACTGAEEVDCKAEDDDDDPAAALGPSLVMERSCGCSEEVCWTGGGCCCC